VSALPEEAPSRLDLWFSRSADGAPVLPGHERSRVSAGRMEITAEHLPDGAETYLCGSSALLQGAREQLRLSGADEERVPSALRCPNDWLLPGSRAGGKAVRARAPRPPPRSAAVTVARGSGAGA